MAEHISVPPGWYPDPLEPGCQRYWDGAAWTDHTAAGVQAAKPKPPTTFATSASRSMPWWQSTWAIVFGMVLCLPVGLVGLWRRPGLSTSLRSWVTVGAVAVLAVALALPSESTDDKPASDSARSLTGTVPGNQPDPVVASSPPTQVVTPEVPAVVGMSGKRALDELTTARLTLGKVTKQPSEQAPGTVLRQSIEPGTALAAGGAVALVVAEAYPKVPGVVGTSKASGIAALKRAGFRVVTTLKNVSKGEDNVVLSQSPKGNASLKPGSTIKLVISDYKEPAAPPPSSCTTGYDPCLEPMSDYDCASGAGNGPGYANGPIYVSGSDPYDLDSDGDGVACEN